MKELIGLKIVAVKGVNYERNFSGKIKKKKHIDPEYIFFSDKETYMTLSEQDYYTYHDCSSSARNIDIRKNKEEYKNIITSPNLSDSNTEL